jgi:ABC-type multidrug transport system permease subunit
MRFIWNSAVKDFRRIRREPTTLVVWLGIPTLVAVLLTVIFGRGDTPPHGKLLIADEDGGVASFMLTSSFSQGALGKMLTVEKVSTEDGRRQMDKGNASALLVVPKGFTSAVLNNRPAKLELIKNPALQIIPAIIEETVSMLADGVFYLQAVAGEQLRTIPLGQPAESQIAQSAVETSRLAQRLQRYLAPRLIQLNTKVIRGEFDQPGAFAVVLFPSMVYMAVFFIAGGLASDVWRERTAGALRRVLSTPSPLGGFLAGKVLAAAIVLAATGALGLTLAHWLLGLPVPNFALAILWLAASGCGLYLLIMLLQTFASSERVANLLSNFILLPLSMLGGSFFPLETMPAGMARIGRWTPNGWSLTHLKAILGGSLDWTPWAIVASFLIAGWLLAIWRIRRMPC